MTKIKRELTTDQAIAATQAGDGDPDMREALVNLVKKGEIVAAISADNQLCFQAKGLNQ